MLNSSRCHGASGRSTVENVRLGTLRSAQVTQVQRELEAVLSSGEQGSTSALQPGNCPILPCHLIRGVLWACAPTSTHQVPRFMADVHYCFSLWDIRGGETWVDMVSLICSEALQNWLFIPSRGCQPRGLSQGLLGSVGSQRHRLPSPVL